MFKPFRVLNKRRLTFVMWVSFSLVGGAVGILVSILRHGLFTQGLDLRDAVAIEVLNGAFFYGSYYCHILNYLRER